MDPAPTHIALNVTRTRVTVLVFNLAVISLMLSIKAVHGAQSPLPPPYAFTTLVALFCGFCLTLLGLFWLLLSQELDSQGLSHPWTFSFGALTNYLALSQTMTAFMHKYVVEIGISVEAIGQQLVEGSPSQQLLVVAGTSTRWVLIGMGAVVWLLITYVAPIVTGLRCPIPSHSRWILATYYLVVLMVCNWVYARAWQVEHLSEENPGNVVYLVFMQFVQPCFWIR